MAKYVYIVRRMLDYSGKIEYEKAMANLDDAKEFIRERMTRYSIAARQRYVRVSQQEKDRIRKEYENMTIKLRKSDWTWTHYDNETYEAVWELKRLEIIENI